MYKLAKKSQKNKFLQWAPYGNADNVTPNKCRFDYFFKDWLWKLENKHDTQIAHSSKLWSCCSLCIMFITVLWNGWRVRVCMMLEKWQHFDLVPFPWDNKVMTVEYWVLFLLSLQIFRDYQTTLKQCLNRLSWRYNSFLYGDKNLLTETTNLFPWESQLSYTSDICFVQMSQ